MKVLGVHSLTHDSGTSLCVDGEIAFALEEERLSRIKHHFGIEVEGTPPLRSLNWILKEANLTLNEIDKIVHVGWEGDDFMKLDLIRNRYREFAFCLDPGMKKTSFVSHHRAHAASAYYSSGFEDAIVLAVDGAGDWVSTSLYIGEGEKMNKVDQYPLDESLGFMYSRAAKILGLGDFGFSEGKLTALAAYGNPNPSIVEVAYLHDGKYTINKNYYDIFKKFRRSQDEPITQEQKDFAATVQKSLEDIIIYILTHAYNKYCKKNIVLAGGVALNCRMNGKISSLPWIDKIFIQPAANDGGLCVGAAYLGALAGGDKIHGMNTPYLGPDINNLEVEKYITRNGLTVEKVNPEETAAQKIAQGKTVAWMQGKLEFGPRALGHRSLLGDPRKIDIKDKLNVIKQRDSWRPVAPAIIDGASRYCDLNNATEFMTKAIPMNKLALNEIPGAIHVDGTARVQFVKDKKDIFFKLISSFERLTGIPAVLNTSLNSRGEPICTTIDEGVKFFYTTPTDYLMIGTFLFKK
jgi:carbamoyltransferase